MKKFICAPMATLSHEAFRLAVETFGGCDEYFTEMINASSLLTMGPFEKYYLLDGPCPEKIVWQLTGWDIDHMTQAAGLLSQKAGIGIDLNMGCSAPQIYKTGAGISWMLKPLEESRKLVKEVKSILPREKRLSVKCRLGAEDFTEDSFFTFTDMLVQEGVQCITLHPRTIKEKYRGNPKYSYAAKLTDRYKNDDVEIILNGNISDYASARYALSQAPDCSGLMIARAAAVKPWIFDQIRSQLSAEEKGVLYEANHKVDRKKTALDFIENVQKCQPQEFWKTRIQRFFNYYCQQFKFGHYFQSRLLNYKGIEESVFEINDYFEKQADEQYIYY